MQISTKRVKNLQTFMEVHQIKHNQQFRLPYICGGWALFKINESNIIEVVLEEGKGPATLWTGNHRELCDHAWRHMCSGEAKVAVAREPHDEKLPELKMDPTLIIDYIDGCIRHWRVIRNNEDHEHKEIAIFYIDAYQSMRSSLYGSTLPLDLEDKNNPPKNYMRNFMENNGLNFREEFTFENFWQLGLIEKNLHIRFIIEKDYKIMVFKGYLDSDVQTWIELDKSSHPEHKTIWDHICRGDYGNVIKF